MATVLPTKPGINGANVLSIPKTWDPTWFRNFIANSLKGADVRNATGTNGITVSGNISSPYATIGFGGPATITGPIFIFSDSTLGDPALSIDTSAGNPGVSFFQTTNMPNTAPPGITFEYGFGSPTRGRLIIGDGTGWDYLISSWTGGVATDLIQLNDKSGALIGFGASGAYTGASFTNKGILNYDTSGGDLTLAARSTGGSTRIVLRTSNAGSDTARVIIDNAGLVSVTGTMAISGNWGINGAGAQAASLGWGTPTGNATVTNFPGGGPATLAQCSSVIAQIIVQLKRYGLFGA